MAHDILRFFCVVYFSNLVAAYKFSITFCIKSSFCVKLLSKLYIILIILIILKMHNFFLYGKICSECGCFVL